MEEIRSLSFMGRYSVGDGYIVEVLKDEKEGEYEAWFYHKHYGIKMLMFGCPVSQQRYREFLDMVNGKLDEYKKVYYDLYLQYEEEGE